MKLAVLESAELTDAQFERISQYVKSICGINLHDGKKELVKARLGKRLRTLNLRNYDGYLEYLRNDASGDELITMLDSISTNLTHFFRESAHFDYLSKNVLPRIVARAGKGTGRIRIWSAGCSSGDEPYSLAILLQENIPGLAHWDAKILATDLSTRMLTAACKGVYGEERLREMQALLVSRYFDCVEPHAPRRFQLKQNVKSLVTFARLNLMESWPMRGPFDAIFCRNVMIYFDKPTQARLIQRFWDILGHGGVLFVGHSESLAGVDHRFSYVQPTVYRKD